ncbi:MAG: carbohydrate deacetylase [Nitrospinota bacterium]
MKSVIINADDFGVSEGANRAIAELFSAGSLTSTSLMTNMEFSDQAAKLALNQNIKTGFHLCLAAGKPISQPGQIPTLVDESGNFWLRSQLLKRVFKGLVSMKEVEQEFDAQIKKFFKYGLSPDHLNTDQHVHLLPGLQEISIKLAQKYSVPLRVPDERLIFNSWFPTKNFFTSKIPMKLLAFRLKSRCKKESIETNDHLISIFGFLDSRLSCHERYLKLVECYIRPGITEIMVHPAYSDKTLEKFWIGGVAQGREREEEVKALHSLEFKRALKNSETLLTSYSEIYMEGRK